MVYLHLAEAYKSIKTCRISRLSKYKYVRSSEWQTQMRTFHFNPLHLKQRFFQRISDTWHKLAFMMLVLSNLIFEIHKTKSQYKTLITFIRLLDVLHFYLSYNFEYLIGDA